MTPAKTEALENLARAAKSAVDACDQKKGEVFMPPSAFRWLREQIRILEEVERDELPDQHNASGGGGCEASGHPVGPAQESTC